VEGRVNGKCRASASCAASLAISAGKRLRSHAARRGWHRA
jgi:hypothetical protein